MDVRLDNDGGDTLASMEGSLISTHGSGDPSSLHGNGSEASPDASLLADNGTDDETVTSSTEELYNLLAVEDAPKFTLDEYEHEQKNLSEEERIELLTDLFGNSCQIINAPARKRVRRQPAQQPSIVALLEDMKRELETIPKTDKFSLLEAQSKADASEFSDERLEQFLRRENMDPQVRLVVRRVSASCCI